jgi:hypothetical protein
MQHPAKTRVTIYLSYRVPRRILPDLKRPEINVNGHLVLAFEIIWYPPRIPARRASTKFEIT